MRRTESDDLEVVGDGSQLTREIRIGLVTHKATFLEMLAPPTVTITEPFDTGAAWELRRIAIQDLARECPATYYVTPRDGEAWREAEAAIEAALAAESFTALREAVDRYRNRGRELFARWNREVVAFNDWCQRLEEREAIMREQEAPADATAFNPATLEGEA